jgi:hypothetical protein
MSQMMDLDEFLDTLPDTLEQVRTRNPDCGGRIRGLLQFVRQFRVSTTSLRLRLQVIDGLLGLEQTLEVGSTDRKLVSDIIVTLQGNQLV